MSDTPSIPSGSGDADVLLSPPALEEVLLAALFAAERPLGLDELADLFDLGEGVETPTLPELEAALAAARERLAGLPLELIRVASGYRIEVPPAWARWVSRLWVERPARYSRALLETLALIAYRQPITRPEIESVRGVAVSTHIVRTLEERGWIRSVGHRDAPGRPALYGTTRVFLDYFGLTSLDELPTLAEIRDIAEFEPELPLEEEPEEAETPESSPEADEADADAAEVGRGEAGESPALLRGPWPDDASGSDSESASDDEAN
ncbi:MAG: SMC-Scp complex subunit ScpB [Gammaproteobacteria bacterium]